MTPDMQMKRVPTVSWGEFRTALESQTMYVVQCAESIAYMQEIQSTSNSKEWYPPFGTKGKEWTDNNKRNYDFPANVKQGGTCGGECCGYNLTTTLNNDYLQVLKKSDDNEVEYYHRIRKRALEYCLAVYASYLASTVPSVAMLTSTSMADMKINPAFFMVARTYAELEASTKNSGCTPGQLREWDYHIHKEALQLLATIGIVECGYFNPAQLVQKVLANKLVNTSTLSDWITYYATDRQINPAFPGSKCDVTTGLVVDVTPAEQDQVEPVSKEDEDELEDADNNIVTGDAALTVIFPSGFKTTRLFPMGFLKDFISWVRKLLPTLALHVITLVFMCLI